MYGVSGFFGGFCGFAGVFTTGWFAVKQLLVSEERGWTFETSASLSVLNDAVAVLTFCGWLSTMTALFTTELLRLALTAALPASAVRDEDGEFVADDHPVSITTGCITCIIAVHLLTVLKSASLYLSADFCDQLAGVCIIILQETFVCNSVWMSLSLQS